MFYSANFTLFIDNITIKIYNLTGDVMKGVNLDKPIIYKHASLRFFNKNEKHITRICEDDVLVMVFDGILRFSENKKECEVKPGEYYIQQKNLLQEGILASDSPKYLYVHFKGEWTDEGTFPYKGVFDQKKMMEKMKEMDNVAHGNYNYTKRCEKFYEILNLLNNKSETKTVANKIADFIDNEKGMVSLEEICKNFNFSKNHIINIFKKQYGVTPVKYINDVKLKNARYLLEVTSESVENIAIESGFGDYSHFYKLFFRENKMSPTEWRKQKQVIPY